MPVSGVHPRIHSPEFGSELSSPAKSPEQPGPVRAEADEAGRSPPSRKASQPTLAQLAALGISLPQRPLAGTVKSFNLEEAIADTQDYIKRLEARVTVQPGGAEGFNRTTDDIISRNAAAPHGNDRLMTESIAMINASRAAGEPPIRFAPDIYNALLHLKNIQTALQQDENASAPKTLRLVFKPNEEDYDHTLMCECDVHRDRIVIAAIDSNKLQPKSERTARLLVEAATLFPEMNIKMGVCFTGVQRGWGCLHYALATAELVPSRALEEFKKKIEESGERCLTINDEKADMLPLEAFIYAQSHDQADAILKKSGTAETPAGQMLQRNKNIHGVVKINDDGVEKSFINSLPSYRLSTLRKLLRYLEGLKKTDPEGKGFALALEETLAAPDQSWRKPMAMALSGLQWTPEEEVPKLKSELKRMSLEMGEPHGTEFRIRKAKEFLDAFPFLESSRLRSIPRQMVREMESDEGLAKEDKLDLIKHAISVFENNDQRIRNEERPELLSLKMLLAAHGDMSMLFSGMTFPTTQ